MLKGFYEKLEDAPEGLREHYKQGEDGKFYADVDGYAPKAKLEEFRENNRKLFSEISELKERYKDLDPEDYKRLRSELEEVRAGKGETVGRILSAEQKRLQEEYGRRLQTTAKERDEFKAKADTYRDKHARSVLAKKMDELLGKEKIKLSGPGAFSDLVGRASQYWEADPDSEAVSYKKADAFADAPSPAEWLRGLLRDPLHQHLFEGAAGGVAKGSGRTGANGKRYITREEAHSPDAATLQGIADGTIEITG